MEDSFKTKAILSSHINVYSSCLALMDKNGWKIVIEPFPYEDEDSGIGIYKAFKDKTEIMADNPLELLGLASIHEYHHPHGDESYWWTIKSDNPDFVYELEDGALEKAFFEYKERDYIGWRKCVSKALEDAELDDEVPAHERLGIREDTLERILSDFSDTE